MWGFFLFFSFGLIFKNKIFRPVLGSQQSWTESREGPHILPAPTFMQPLLLWASCSRVVPLLQLMNLHWHIIITQSLQFTLGFTLGIVNSVGFDKCVVTCIHHYSIRENRFTALKIPCALLFHPSLPLYPWKPLIYLMSP